MSQGKIRDLTDWAVAYHRAGVSRNELNRRYLAHTPTFDIAKYGTMSAPEHWYRDPNPTEADPHPRSCPPIRQVPPHDPDAPPPKWGPRAIPRIHGVTLSPVTLSLSLRRHVSHSAVAASTSTALPQRVSRVHRHRRDPRPIPHPPTQVRCLQYATLFLPSWFPDTSSFR